MLPSFLHLSNSRKNQSHLRLPGSLREGVVEQRKTAVCDLEGRSGSTAYGVGTVIYRSQGETEGTAGDFPGAGQAGLQDGRAGALLVPRGFDRHAEAQGYDGGSWPRDAGKELARRAQHRVLSPAGADVGASTCPPHAGHRTCAASKPRHHPPVGGRGEG